MDLHRGSPPARDAINVYTYRPEQGGPQGAPERFRHRSRSPGHRRGSPPPPSKRFRRDGDYRDDRFGRTGPPHRGGHRYGPPRDPHQPMTFREFMGQLPNDILPDDAKAEYDRYMAGFFGNEARAEFEQKKNDPAFRRRFDPRLIAEAIDARNIAAQGAAAALNASAATPEVFGSPGPFSPTALNATSPEELQTPSSTGQSLKAPAVCWEDAIVLGDLRLARLLTRTIDSERGVKENELAPALPSALPTDQDKAEGDEGHDAGGSANGAHDVQKAQEEAEAEADERMDPEQRIAALDSLLRYLWIVHGIDYYGGREFGGTDDPEREDAVCTVRPPRIPHSAAPGSEMTDREMEDPPPKEEVVAAQDSERARRAYEDRVIRRWQARIEKGDPMARLIQSERVEREISGFIDRQIVKHDDQKWGNKISAKLFVAREFVVKHIRNKHGHVLDAERSKIFDQIFFENFKATKDRENRRVGGGGFHHRGDHGFGGRGRGRGRGGGGGMVGGPPGMMVMGPPILVPGGGMHPGGGFQPPMIMAPMDVMMPMGMRAGGGGRGGGRGMRGGGGRGGFPGAPVMMGSQGGSYFDLDDPKNNRVVLDYGDL